MHRGATAAIAGILILSPSPRVTAAPPVARYTANALNIGGDAGPAATLVSITIDRWSSEDEHNQLADPLTNNAQADAAKALRKLPRVGVIRALDQNVEPLYYARRTAQPDGGERILLIGVRPMQSFEQWMKTNMSAFPFSVIQLVVDATGNGTGTLTLAATLKGAREQPITAVPDRFVLPVRLTKVKRVADK